MAFNWPFPNYGFYGLLGISITPFLIFTNLSFAQSVENNLLRIQTGNRGRKQGVIVIFDLTLLFLFQDL